MIVADQAPSLVLGYIQYSMLGTPHPRSYRRIPLGHSQRVPERYPFDASSPGRHLRNLSEGLYILRRPASPLHGNGVVRAA
jgi:hypothetical protein